MGVGSLRERDISAQPKIMETVTGTCSEIWRPERKEIDTIMLEIGMDPSKDDYLDSMSKLLARVYGCEIVVQVACKYRLPNNFKLSGDSLDSFKSDLISYIGKKGSLKIKRDIVDAFLLQDIQIKGNQYRVKSEVNFECDLSKYEAEIVSFGQ